MKAFLIAYLLSGAVSTQEPCIQYLEGHFERMKSFSELVEGKTYFLEMEMFYKDNPLKEGGSDVNLNSTLYVNTEQYVFESSTISVYQDNSDAFMIVHPQKKIIRREPIKVNHAEQFEKVTQLQEEILKTNQGVTCTDKKVDSNINMIVTLKPSAEIVKNDMVTEVEFEFSDNKKLKEVSVNFSSNHQFLLQRITYVNMDLDVKSWKNRPVTDYVFMKEGQLNERYKNYQIIDNRNID
ncbi:hypothetical protein SAMN05421640_2491 [Ekhidna lutea]|uniref:Uncharacterized protein n=1 Tax=Ekhidna lutea TaxID=447679 RepID=A0A239K787_EKHLU|nr:hypothetical protein [Ekhidna lutea]SNT14326.1 hypothetical protein SAMN05421640_2491 [Ekhidna lutea]